ncbi:hypothetical protein [Streptomyces sp. NPDC006415]|uniref:hypothetical protein n=1 Tax=Streptomyces sp. NPDC006415 TaxID=3155351 RepID=UPI0033B7C5B8
MRARVARGLRVAVWAVLPGEAVLVVCLVAGVRIPGAVLLGPRRCSSGCSRWRRT